MEIGMYYMDSHRGRHYTQDGYVLYKRCSQQEHQDMGLALPSQIEVGAKKPITVDIAGLHHKNRRKGKRQKRKVGYAMADATDVILLCLFLIAVVGIFWDLFSSFW